ncbi:hypothetical protein BGY98DRAFT_708751 [Russula aff. rugulosa BPL654]|nr:hypothetical protein BGY98DRAFT_708751 [Russula aff. rugulosa BPL654]
MNAPKPENVCAICKKVFSRKADCNRHLRLHTGVRPYPCEVAGCGKRFAQFTALKTHRNVHTGLKPFKCDSCNATFGDPHPALAIAGKSIIPGSLSMSH